MTNTRMYKVYFTQSHEDAKTVRASSSQEAEEKLKETQELIEERNIKSEIFVADVALESEVLNLKREVDAKMGDPDILINNAGTAIRKDVVEFGLNEWQNVINTNLTSAFMMSKAHFSRVKYKNLSQGIVALHSGWKI